MNKILESDNFNNQEFENINSDKNITSDSNDMSEVSGQSSENLPSDLSKLSKSELIESIKNFTTQEVIPSRQEVDAIKTAYYSLRQVEINKEKEIFEENNDDSERFEPTENSDDIKVKEYLRILKEKRAAKILEEEKEKEENYKKKNDIICEMKKMVESHDDFNTLFNKFKDLQAKWLQIGYVPANKSKDLWKEYQILNEKFYDLQKINNELRDYDFKKNLELKKAILETARKLLKEENPISAFHQLQNLHDQWREIGPVEKTLRENLWTEFKELSTKINKNFQAHFDKIKEAEEENLKLKQAIIEELNKIDFSKLNSFKEWESVTADVIALQEKWKSIGFVPKKLNAKIFEDFRSLCDNFFNKKSEFFQKAKQLMEDNLAKKQSLLDKANELKTSTDWNKTTMEFVKIQKEWKNIGPVPRKYSDKIWKDFVDACDYFFKQKKEVAFSQKDIEIANYKAKKDIVEKIKNLDVNLSQQELTQQLKNLQDEWYAIGHVPFKEKDRAYKELYAAVDKHYNRIKIDKNERQFAQFESDLQSKLTAEGNAEKILAKERDFLVYQYNKTKADLQVYENNMNFLSLSTKDKDNNPLFKDVNKKVNALKEHLSLLEKKITALDSRLNQL